MTILEIPIAILEVKISGAKTSGTIDLDSVVFVGERDSNPRNEIGISI